MPLVDRFNKVTGLIVGATLGGIVGNYLGNFGPELGCRECPYSKSTPLASQTKLERTE